MRILIVILAFLYVIYAIEKMHSTTNKSLRAASAAYYIGTSIVTVAYIAVCAYLFTIAG